MGLSSTQANPVLRVSALGTERWAADAQVEWIEGARMSVLCGGPWKVGAAVRLDASDRMFLAEVLGFQSGSGGARALLKIRHSLLWSDVRQLPAGPGPRADAAGA